MSDTKEQRRRRDHYVPQGYLRGFADENGDLWAFIIKRDCWKKVTPSAIGSEGGFYDFSPDVKAAASVDPIFTEIENDFPQAVARLAPHSDWRSYRKALVKFAALQSARTKGFERDAATGLLTQIPDADDALQRDHVRALMTVEGGAREAWFLELPWAIGFNSDPSDPLVTCDIPVGMIGFHDADMLFMPLSPKLCLLGGPTVPEGAWVPMKRLGVAEIRGYCAKAAEFFIASPKPWGKVCT